jgi:hypothetical protein
MDIITSIKVGGFKWAGHAVRMDQRRPGKEFLMPNQQVEEKEELRWKDRVDNDVKALGEINWKNVARNRQISQKLLRRVMARTGMFCR